MKSWYFLVTLIVAALCSDNVFGQDVQPRAFTPAPVGVNIAAISYAYSTGELLFDKTLPVENVQGDINSIGLAYSRTFGLFGLSGRADLTLPFVDGDWTGDVTRGDAGIERQAQSRTGLADPMARIVLNLIGAPAMTRSEFATFSPSTVVSLIMRVKAPLGQYDPEKLLNLGSNRWAFSPQLAVSHIKGRLLLEAHAGAWLFTENDQVLGTSTLRQDPLFSFQVHMGYLTRKGLWIAVSSRQSFGAATQVDGGEKAESEANNRVGVAISVPMARAYALKLLATTSLTATVGND